MSLRREYVEAVRAASQQGVVVAVPPAEMVKLADLALAGLDAEAAKLFKVGDRVRVVEFPTEGTVGRTGVIHTVDTADDGIPYLVDLDNGGDCWFKPGELEKE